MWMYDSRPCSRAPRPRSVTWTRARVVIVGRGADDRMAKRGRLPITRACVHVHTHTRHHTRTHTHSLSFLLNPLYPYHSLSFSLSQPLRHLSIKPHPPKVAPRWKGRQLSLLSYRERKEKKKKKQPTTEKNKPNNNNKKGNFVIVDTNRNAIGVPEHGGMLVKEAGGCWKHAGPESMSRSLFSSAPRLAWPRPFSRDRVACGE